MKRILTIMICCAMSAITTAQQEPFMSFYDDGITAINPGAFRTEQMTGFYSIFARFAYRQQWQGFDFAPRTMQVQVEGWAPNTQSWLAKAYPNRRKEVTATRAGFHLTVDDSDPLKFYNAYGQLAQQIPLSDYSFISVGFNFGLISYQFDPSNLDEDPNLIPDSNTTLDAGTGVLFAHYNDDDDPLGFFVGLSIPHVLGIDLNFERGGEPLEVERVMHYYLVAGGAYGDRNGWGRIKPTVVIGWVPKAPLYVNGNVEYQYSIPSNYENPYQIWASIGLEAGQGATWNTDEDMLGYKFTASSMYARGGVNVPYSDTGAFRIGFGYNFFNFGEILKLGNTYEFTLSWMMNGNPSKY